MSRDNPAPGRDTAMSAVLYGLKDTDMEHLAHYFAHFGREPQGGATDAPGLVSGQDFDDT